MKTILYDLQIVRCLYGDNKINKQSIYKRNFLQFSTSQTDIFD